MCCIIISKPAGIAVPSIDTLKNCWDRNSDGAGYAIAKNGVVRIHKGIMTWREFAKIDFAALTPFACIFHFRWATHGSKSAGNTHPFPVTGDMRKCKRAADVAIAHNGVIPRVRIVKDDYSDTMSYIEKRIAPYWKECKKRGSYMFSVKASRKILLDETGSKWAFLYPNGHIINVGQGIKVDGVWFSNNGFRSSHAYPPIHTAWTPGETASQDWNPDPDWVNWYNNRPAISMAGMY